MINNQDNKSNIYRLLAKPSFGRLYLLNALDSSSETIFIEALHQIIEAIADEREITLFRSYRDRR
jgi:hypothetical protein